MSAIVVLCLTSLLSACGSGQVDVAASSASPDIGSVSSTPSTPSTPSTTSTPNPVDVGGSSAPSASPSVLLEQRGITLFGSVIKGPAECDISIADTLGSVLANTRSLSDGSYQASILTEKEAVIVTATDCRYIDETSGLTVEGITLRAGVSTLDLISSRIRANTRLKINVTPFSDIALKAAYEDQALVSREITASEITTFNEAVSNMLDGSDFDILSDDPILATDDSLDDNTEDTQQAVKFGLYLAAVSGAGDVAETIDALAAELDPGSATLGAQTVERLVRGANAFDRSGRNNRRVSALGMMREEVSKKERPAPDKNPTKPTSNSETETDVNDTRSVLSITKGSGSGEYDIGDLISIAADEPRDGFKFVEWLGDTRNLDDPKSSTALVTVGSIDMSITAFFAPISHLQINVLNGAGSGKYVFNRSQILRISANESPGKVFIEWVGDTQLLESPTAPNSVVYWPDSNTSLVISLEPRYDTDFTLNNLATREDVSRFLSFAGFGATSEELDAWRGQDAAQWLKNEFSKPAELLATQTKIDAEANESNNAPFSRYVSYHLNHQLIESDAQLRTKMTYALSQILVVGGDHVNNGKAPIQGMGYRDVLHDNAFGNYRELLEKVTYSPAMASWLTYLRSSKANPDNSSEPDENYARELLQLFTLGLHELENNGNLRLGSDGLPIPIYDNDDVAQLARVFTGFSYDSTRYREDNDLNRSVSHLPLKIFPKRHSDREKVFLNTYIPENTSGEDSVTLALDEIFSHSTIAPFISRQLIQRFTSSHPTPSYIERVSHAFNTGWYSSANGTEFGSGHRGDLESTLAAILLDETVFADSENNNVKGKVREPLLKYVHFMRAFKVENLEFMTRTIRLLDLTRGDSLNMAYFESPSVFNFYRPGYVPPLTQAGARGMTVPEFQIADSSSFYGYIGLMVDLAIEKPRLKDCIERVNFRFEGLEPCNSATDAQQFKPNYDQEVLLADNPLQLVDRLNTLLLGGRMDNEVRQEIAEVIALIPLEPGVYAERLRERVRVAVLMVLTAPSYSVIW